MAAGIETIWYGRSLWRWPLLPLSGLYCLITAIRGLLYRTGLKRRWQAPVPVIVVGNLAVGGTGKSPLVMRLAAELVAAGYRPGLVSRGYGGQSERWPRRVEADSDPAEVGDEPVMLVRRTGLPMAVGPDRPAAVRELLAAAEVDVVISDDGLQHLALNRDIEIVVIDGQRQLGNGWCLPAGPLRERAARLDAVDFVVVNGGERAGGHAMQLAPADLIHLADAQRRLPLAELAGQRVHAVAGIGNPSRFFATLRGAGLEVIEHPLPDHHVPAQAEYHFADQHPVIMTEKDAVKCRADGHENIWYLPVEAHLDGAFITQLLNKLESVNRG